MTSASNSPGSYFSSKIRSSKIEGNYLKELSEDLKLRKQELLELFKPLEDRNSLLFQKLMSNLEEKQRSLQIMRQIMAGKGNDDSSVTELIKEAEEMKQNLERKNKMLRNEMEMLWNKTFNTEELSEQQKVLQMKNKADMQDGKAPKTPSSSRKTKNELEMLCAEKVKEIRKEKQQRKMEWVKYQEQANIFQNEFSGKVIELRIEALKNYQKANDLKLSLYIQQNFEPKQASLNLPGSQGTMGITAMCRATTDKDASNVRILGSKTYTEQQGAQGSQFDDGRGRLFFLRSMPDEALKD
ncbi:putative coiled-coil domain-containing protein 196 [Camelus dromedarius]|uniref:putative coiled-coil domain-containing protein 196 n=1 Tax=Camelus dromedarius TaxID=9838 RepID=UPI00057BAAAE|nr:putative coiled-coil domain-containing protein 196 [Camelus dromedarius]XP_031308625.1 putative coiled-coil domain-containing protein 196 [Camelus dromedarius]